MKKEQKSIRCAIYTRKSTDENLDLEFNSLDAQREAGEAYIVSQRSEGWLCNPEKYDDGGFTGGNMERPALKRLLADVAAGKVDCIVVYKVDRLSRSISDFAKIMEVFEKHNVSFVSVTQQFNTTTSMGRLMLNVLLSFAQFEREIISERTRDKIAATRRKGKWSGGTPILGYDIDAKGGRLLVNDAEAARVRQMFRLYQQHGSLKTTINEMNRLGWKAKQWTSREGKPRGGNPFNKSTLHNLLSNVLYIGKVSYKGEIVKGEQPALIDAKQFQDVQAMLQRNGRDGGTTVRNKYGALLRDVLVCGPCQCSMTHSYTQKDEQRQYRYYVCSKAQRNGWDTCPTKSISAPKIEEFVVGHIKQLMDDKKLIRETLRKAHELARTEGNELAAERKRLEREGIQLQDELREVATKRKPDTARLAQLQALSVEVEGRLIKLRNRLETLPTFATNARELASALRQFEPVWAVLSPRERARIVELIVERVAYDGKSGKVAVTFRALGLQNLAERLAAKEA